MKRTLTSIFITLVIAAGAYSQEHKPMNPKYQVDTIPMIYDLIEQVDTAQFMSVIQHLSSYTTRMCTSPESFEAQDWLKTKLEGYGLDVVLQDFPLWMGASSDNVIATLPGKVTPDEYVFVGSHYDSYSYNNVAPGADDNASGTSGVLEVARILSSLAFERSIVFCAFSGEEVGLVGSDYYASHAAQFGMDILGYFNFDMIGYLHPGDEIHTDMIAPASALELENFYTDVAAIYLPDFEVAEAEPIGGDSDHTSFNNNGYMGIFPFEDTPNYSPYIHTPMDVIGTSVNSPEMAKTFIQATLASLVTLAIPYDSTVGMQPRPPITSAVRIFPNPANGFVSVKNVDGKTMDVRINGISGQTLLETNIHGQGTMDISKLSPGIYFVRCEGKDLNETLKLIKR